MKIHPIPVFLALLAVLFVPTLQLTGLGETRIGWQFVFTPGMTSSSSPVTYVILVAELALIVGLGIWLSRREAGG